MSVVRGRSEVAGQGADRCDWRVEARLGTHAELLLAFWASVGLKADDFMTKG